MPPGKPHKTPTIVNDDTRKLFVDAFIANGQNVAAAGRTIGVTRVTAQNIRRDPRTERLIRIRMAAIQRKNELTAEEVIDSLARAIRFDPGKMYNPDGSLKLVSEMPEDVRLELESVDIDAKYKFQGKGKKKVKLEIVTAKVGMPKKHAARDQAMKYFGLYAKDKQGYDPENDKEPPPPIAVTINFRDARRKKRTGGDD